MTAYIIDTHTLVWFFTEDAKLPKRDFNILKDSKTEVIIPTIVLAEFLYIARRIPKIDFRSILEKIKLSKNCKIYSLSLAVIEEMLQTNETLEMHDRIIVATARLLDASILTKDRIIRKVYSKTIW